MKLFEVRIVEYGILLRVNDLELILFAFDKIKVYNGIDCKSFKVSYEPLLINFSGH